MSLPSRGRLATMIEEAFASIAPQAYAIAGADGTLAQIISDRIEQAVTTYDQISTCYDESPVGLMTPQEQWEASGRARFEALEITLAQVTEFCPDDDRFDLIDTSHVD